MHDMKHMDYLETVSKLDMDTLQRKEATYQGSWKKRGGVGAFMMAARKWDRLENMMNKAGFDVLGAMHADTSGRDGTVLAEVRDLRQYLMLFEAEIMARMKLDSHMRTRDSIREAMTGILLPETDITKMQPRNGGAVPAEDSNKHAERRGSVHTGSGVERPGSEDYKAGTCVDGEWKLLPMISESLWRRLSPEFQKRYVVVGLFAHVDRRLYTEAERLAKFRELSQTLTRDEWTTIPAAYRGFYETRDGVENEFQLIKEYRECWGA